MITIYGKQLKLMKIIYKYYKKNIILTPQKLSNLSNIEFKEVMSICRNLSENKLIKFNGINTPTIKLSPDGIDYFSFKRTERFNIFLKSIFFPIIVAFITAIITSLLTMWLKGLL